MNNRSRKLLDLAHTVNECTNCGTWTLESGKLNGRTFFRYYTGEDDCYEGADLRDMLDAALAHGEL